MWVSASWAHSWRGTYRPRTCARPSARGRRWPAVSDRTPCSHARSVRRRKRLRGVRLESGHRTKAARARGCGKPRLRVRALDSIGRPSRHRGGPVRGSRHRYEVASRGGPRALGGRHRPRDTYRAHRESHEDVLRLRGRLRRGAQHARVPGLSGHARRAAGPEPARHRPHRARRARHELRDRPVLAVPSQAVLLSRHAEGLPDLPVRPAVLRARLGRRRGRGHGGGGAARRPRLASPTRPTRRTRRASASRASTSKRTPAR